MNRLDGINEGTAAPIAAPSSSWLFSRRLDLSIIALPWGLTLLTWVYTLSRPELRAMAHSYAGWASRFVLGNSTHVVLTFLLLFTRRDVLHATQRQGRLVTVGCSLVAVLTFALFWVTSRFYPLWGDFLLAIVVLFAMHHTLSQAKGIWSLYSMRGAANGAKPPTPRERSLQQLFVPLALLLTAVRILFVPASAEVTFPWVRAVNGLPAILPFSATWVLLIIWTAYAGALLREVWLVGNATLPKGLCITDHLAVVAITLVAPTWGMTLSAGIHGLEYFMVSAQMLRPTATAEDERSLLTRRLVAPAMLAAITPALIVGLLNAPFTRLFATPSPGFAWLQMALNGVVFAHYFADAFIFRFRIPEVRRVALRRLGFQK